MTREKRHILALVFTVAGTVLTIGLALYVGYVTTAPDVYIPTPLNEYAARMKATEGSYPLGR